MKGNVNAVAILAIVLGSLFLLITLTDIVEPLTTYTDQDAELMNLTGLAYLTPTTPLFDTVMVYNDTLCNSSLLTANIDYVLDRGLNGNIVNATPVVGPVGNALYFDGNDTVNIVSSTSTANIAGDMTIIGWVKPTNI